MLKSELDEPGRGETLRRLIEEGQADADRGDVINGDEAFEARRRSRVEPPNATPEPGDSRSTQVSE